MKRIFVFFVALVMLVGCASTDEKKAAAAAAQAKQDRADALTDAMIAAAKVPLIKFTCPANGCVISGLEVGNPMSLGQLADGVKASNAPPAVSESTQLWLGAMDMVGKLGTWAIVSNGVQGIMKSVTGDQAAVANSGFNALSKVQPSVTTTTNTINASGAGSAAAMGGSATATNPVTTTTTTTNTVTGAGVIGGGTLTNPPGKTCSISATGVLTCI